LLKVDNSHNDQYNIKHIILFKLTGQHKVKGTE